MDGGTGVPPTDDDGTAPGSGSPPPEVDFFVWCVDAERGWAAWIAWQLVQAGYRVVTPEWDFVAGSHLVGEIDRAATRARWTVAVLSSVPRPRAYEDAITQLAWTPDASGTRRRLLPVWVEDCPRPSLLGHLVGVELFGVDEPTAGARLLAAAAGQRALPAERPPLPTRPAASGGSRPPFPGEPGGGDTAASGGAPDRPPSGRRGIGPVRGAVLLVVGVLVLVVLVVIRAGAGGCEGRGAHAWAMQTPDGCIGYSDGEGQLFGADPRLQAVERLVFQQNRCAADLRRSNPQRQFLSVVYFADLTPDAQRRDLDSRPRVDELMGILLQQIQKNGDVVPGGSCPLPASEAEPILQVVIANGGRDMRQAETVTRQLIMLARKDPTQVAAVIGMGRSDDRTARAIEQFGRAGLPVVASTLSADGLEQKSPLYFQMVPPNAQEARLVAAYAEHTRKRQVRVYYSKDAADGDDLFVRTLVVDLRAEFARKGIAFVDEGWRGSAFVGEPDASAACADTPDTMLFYAGRAADFGDFLNAVFANCPRGAPRVPVVATDAVHRYVVAPPDTGAPPPGTQIFFVSENALMELTQRDCFRGTVDPANPYANAQLKILCQRIGSFYEVHNTQLVRPKESWPGEWTGFGYDTAEIVAQAAKFRRDGQIQPTPASIARGLRFRYNGATGTADFVTSRLAMSKKEVILGIQLFPASDQSKVPVPTCVYAIDDRPPRADCLS